MSLLKIIEYPNQVLHQKAEEIKTIDNSLKALASNMLETMYNANGIGLAANQVGILKRIIVIDLQEEEEKKNPIVMINPVITKKSKELYEFEEGCLSLKSIKAFLKRPKDIEVTYLNLSLQQQTILASELLSICIQHEVDHLNGILFINRLSKIKRTLLLSKLKKEQMQQS